MSRWPEPDPAATVRFPRVSGDEPAIKAFQEANGGFSPRERG